MQREIKEKHRTRRLLKLNRVGYTLKSEVYFKHCHCVVNKENISNRLDCLSVCQRRLFPELKGKDKAGRQKQPVRTDASSAPRDAMEILFHRRPSISTAIAE